MSRKKAKRNHSAQQQQVASAPKEASAGVQAFTFGEAEPIDRASLFEYATVWRNSRWYEPPINMLALAGMVRAAPHHASAIYLKRNQLIASFVPNKYLSRTEFAAFALDYLIFQNAYFEKIPSLAGTLLSLKHVPAAYTRRGLQPGQFWFDPMLGNGLPFEFKTEVVQLRGFDPLQEIYGVPEYMAAVNAALLNQSATLFRRRYYDNGSHAGFILYVSDPAQSPGDIDAMREALRKSKGPGNFRNLFMYSPNGKKDGVQLIPISEVAARDDFAAIKNTSRDDLLAAHRVPPQLLGIIPNNTGGFGDVEKARSAFNALEIEPLQVAMTAINDQLGVEALRFKPPAALQPTQ